MKTTRGTRAAGRRRFAAALGCVLALSVATSAQAQLPDLPDTADPLESVTSDVQNTPQENTDTIPDTDTTPHAKDGSEKPVEIEH